MGVVIGARPSTWSRELALRLLLFVLLAVGVAAIYWIIAYREPPREDWTVAQLAQAINHDEVRRLSITGNRAMVETVDGSRALVHSRTEGSIIGALKALDVPEARLSAVEMVAEAPSAGFGPDNVLLWFCSVPIVIMLLGFGGLMLYRTQAERRTA